MCWPMKIAVQCTRLWDRAWPFHQGRDLPTRVINRATRRGWLRPIWFEFRRGLWMKLDMRDMIQETILLTKLWDPETTEFILDNLSAGNVFVDIGANVGYFTLLAAQRVGDEGRVLCIEPNPSVAGQLRENVERSGLFNVTVVQAACSHTVGPRVLYLSGISNTGRSSLSAENVDGAECVKVHCVTADGLVQDHGLLRIDVVKIDVEGAEFEVLRGMTDILSRAKPKLVLELEPHLLKSFSVRVEDVVDFVGSYGYRQAAVGKGSNYVFVPAAKTEESCGPPTHGQ
jgi:FkbM family methyltransferase